MHKIPDNIIQLIESINKCLKKYELKTYIHGKLSAYILTGQEDLLNKKIDIVLSYKESFNLSVLYKSLIKNIVISKEIENSPNKYSFISSGFEVNLNFVQDFDPTRLAQAMRFGKFNLDILFFDFDEQIFKYPPEVSNIQILKNINDKNNWDFEDILGFITWIGTINNLKIDEVQLDKLKLMSLGRIKESIKTSWVMEIEKILLLKYSGSALKFIATTFADGMPWIFKVLVDYMIGMGARINENSNIETVFNDKKYDLVNLYNDFFLSKTKKIETQSDAKHRLTTTMKLLFDSPGLEIPRPYINRVTTMASGVIGRCCLGSDTGGSISFFGCGDNIEEEECLGLPVECSGNGQCLREHPAFVHIPTQNWEILSVDYREWCPNQVCPDADNIHCLQLASSSSSSSDSV